MQTVAELVRRCASPGLAIILGIRRKRHNHFMGFR
jgi:hypothetical protein